MSVNNDYSERLVCSKDVKKLIIIDCVEEFKRVHKLENIKISQNEILKRIARFYLEH